MVRPRVGHCHVLLQYAFSMLGIIFFPISSSFSPFPFFPFLLLSHSFPLFFLPLLSYPPSPSFLYMSSERFNAQPHTHSPYGTFLAVISISLFVPMSRVFHKLLYFRVRPVWANQNLRGSFSVFSELCKSYSNTSVSEIDAPHMTGC